MQTWVKMPIWIIQTNLTVGEIKFQSESFNNFKQLKTFLIYNKKQLFSMEIVIW